MGVWRPRLPPEHRVFSPHGSGPNPLWHPSPCLLAQRLRPENLFGIRWTGQRPLWRQNPDLSACRGDSQHQPRERFALRHLEQSGPRFAGTPLQPWPALYASGGIRLPVYLPLHRCVDPLGTGYDLRQHAKRVLHGGLESKQFPR